MNAFLVMGCMLNHTLFTHTAQNKICLYKWSCLARTRKKIVVEEKKNP